MPYYKRLAPGSVVMDDRGTTWRIIEDAPDDDGTPAYFAAPIPVPGTTKAKLRPGKQRPILLSCFIKSVVKEG